MTAAKQAPNNDLRARLTEELTAALVTDLSAVEFVCRSTDKIDAVNAILEQVTADLKSSHGSEVQLPEISIVAGRRDRRRAPDPLSEHGCIERQGNVVVVRKMGDAQLLSIEGVTCENPDAPEAERIYRKEFRKKQIYLPDELDTARREQLSGKDVLVMGMTGFSRIGEEACAKLGITERAYVAACADIFGHAIQELKKNFPGIKIKIVDGASDLGVDAAALEVEKVLNLDSLGFSCPSFMFYVKDDDKPVYVAKSQQEYSLAFIRSLDLLFSVGGRLQALKFDMLAAVDEAKRLVRLNVLKAICPYGALPARDANGKIQDATTAFDEAILGTAPYEKAGTDLYTHLRTTAAQLSELVARRLLSPERGYGGWRNES